MALLIFLPCMDMNLQCSCVLLILEEMRDKISKVPTADQIFFIWGFGKTQGSAPTAVNIESIIDLYVITSFYEHMLRYLVKCIHCLTDYCGFG